MGEAVALVGQAQTLLAGVTSQLAPGETYRDFKTSWRAHMSGEKAMQWTDMEKSERSAAFLGLAMLNRFIDVHFRLGRETLLVSPERIAELTTENEGSEDQPPGPPST